MCPGSTGDGGLSSVFSVVDGHELAMVDLDLPVIASTTTTTTTSAPVPIAEKTAPQQETTRTDEQLLAQCHCGGVSFHISRPRDDFIAGEDSTSWLSPLDKKRWLASMDLCDDCRLTTGTNVIGWMFVPVDHISPPLPSNLLVGSSKAYQSSEDVVRTFCGTCGATVFYWCKDRPHIVDVATGLLRAPEGVMAENWAVWRAGRLAWPENGIRYHEGFARALMEGMERWGRERGHAEEFVIP